jgi:hypothetical protein
MSTSKSYYVVVIEDTTTHTIAATGALLIEQKFIHHCGKVRDA